jgi:predicted ATPase
MIKDAHEIGHTATLMYALLHASTTNIWCGSFSTATNQIAETIAVADEKQSLFWNSISTIQQGCIFVLTGKPTEAVQTLTSGIAAYRSTGATVFAPWYLANMTKAYADLDRFDDAWRSFEEAMAAMEVTKERWCEAEVNRTAGELALRSWKSETSKAEGYLARALSVARQQQAKSWELRAAMSMARLWRDQGKRDEACELLAPVYGWFTEGFDTLDLKEAKTLLDELAS